MKSRRDFLKKAGGAMLGVVVAPSLPLPDLPSAPVVVDAAKYVTIPVSNMDDYFMEAAQEIRRYVDAAILEDLKNELERGLHGNRTQRAGRSLLS